MAKKPPGIAHERMEKKEIRKAEGALKVMERAHKGYKKGGLVRKKK